MSTRIDLGDLPVRATRRRVICGCMFNNEINALDWRLHELDAVVDDFIVVESVLTHSGKPRELVRPERDARLSRFRDRLHPVVIHDPPSDPDPWVRERSQRVAIWTQGAANLAPADDDLVIISDVDEVPFPEIVDRLAFAQFDEPIRVRPHWFNFDWNTYLGPWDNASIFFFPAGFLRTLLDVACPPEGDLTVIPANELAGIGGWHASWFGSDESILAKLKDYAHAFDDKDRELAAQGAEGVQRRRSSRSDLHRRRRRSTSHVRLPEHAHRMQVAEPA